MELSVAKPSPAAPEVRVVSGPGTRVDVGAAVELAAMFALVMAFIWFVHVSAPGLIVVPLALVIGSWVARRDTLRTVGLHPADFDETGDLGMMTAVAVAAMALAAGLVNPEFTRQGQSVVDLGKGVLKYYGWALFQQLFLLGYFANRLHRAWPRPVLTAVVAGLLFSVTHIPNPVLMAATFAGGALGAWFFLRSRNLYPLALAHAVLAVAIRYLFESSMKVGPGG